MSETPTPSWSQFVKAHRAATPESLHDQAERIACVPFDWVVIPVTGITYGTLGALTRHRHRTEQITPENADTSPDA